MVDICPRKRGDAARSGQMQSQAHGGAPACRARHPTCAPSPAPATGKLAGLDKKLSKSLDESVQTGSSPLELSMSPVGPLSESSR